MSRRDILPRVLYRQQQNIAQKLRHKPEWGVATDEFAATAVLHPVDKSRKYGRTIVSGVSQQLDALLER